MKQFPVSDWQATHGDPLRLRVGMVHVPKCGGTAITSTLYPAFGMSRTLFVRALTARGDTPQTYGVERKTMAQAFACQLPFLSGHVTYSDLVELGRERIFSILRDPRERMFSLFTYTKTRSRRPHVIAWNPNAAAHTRETFADFLVRTSSQSLWVCLAADHYRKMASRPPVPRTYDEAAASDDFIAVIDGAVARFEFIACHSNEHIRERIAQRFGRDVPVLQRRNETKDGERYEIGMSRDRFVEALEESVGLDRLVFERAARAFPSDFSRPDLPPVEDVVGKLEGRFDLRYSA